MSSDSGHFVALLSCLSNLVSPEVDSSVLMAVARGCTPTLLRRFVVVGGSACALTAGCSESTSGKGLPGESKERWSVSLATLEVSIMRL